ncbi:hypothetical protein KEM09_13165 [Carboxylicivirga mesophila]|uniref:Uncharacterized protein n=1 Tax=Carboxylicivirga mesophila TaxID=1166478 RepID=A0ABS5KBN1_9BACT|nr:hypothetical protein [Carboxylicivirga mesophila]MBS2212359.1 hypothetical protein [Carboxylicivirga mesophila]
MDALVDVINTLSKPEVSEFASFINRQKQKTNRKDLDLFWLLYKEGELSSEDAVRRLYPGGNQVAYHALRKKLMKHLTDFIYFKQLRNDYTAEAQVSAQVAMARYLKEFDIVHLAWKKLKKAEQLAVNNEQYALANQICRLQLEMPLDKLNERIDVVLSKKKRYLRLAIEDDKIDTAYKVIQHHLQKSKVQGEAFDLQYIIEQTLEEFELTQAISNRPSVVYRLMSIVRSAAKSRKAYYEFEPVLLHFYRNMEVLPNASANDIVYVARLQYMVAHTLFRNKKFSLSLDYIYQLREQMRKVARSEYTRLLPRFTQLYCALRFFTGYINEAIRMVDAAFMQKLRLKPEEVLNLKLNKAIYHFYNTEYKVALQELMSIEHSNAWCSKIAGVEWVIKKEFLEIYIQFELGKFDIAANKIRGLLRQKELFEKRPQIERVKVFLQLVNQIVDDPAVAETSEFYEAVETAFDWIPIEQEDLHASVYYAWMKSKIVGEDAYKVLLDLILIE